MQYANQQQYRDAEIHGVEAAWPIRPEPMMSDRVSAVPGLDYAHAASGRQAVSTVRSQLAAAFQKLGVGSHAKAVYERTRDFYRSSGHDWTRGLK